MCYNNKKLLLEVKIMSKINNDLGNVVISEDVVATISAVSAMEVEGVSSLVSSISDNIKEFLTKNSASKGVIVDIDGSNVSVTLNIVIKYNYKIQDVVVKVQNEVIKSVSDMTGYNITAVNVNVMSVDIPKKD